MPLETHNPHAPWDESNPPAIAVEQLGHNFVCHASFGNCGVVAAGMTEAQAEFNAKQKLRVSIQMNRDANLLECLAHYSTQYREFTDELYALMQRNRQQ